MLVGFRPGVTSAGDTRSACSPVDRRSAVCVSLRICNSTARKSWNGTSIHFQLFIFPLPVKTRSRVERFAEKSACRRNRAQYLAGVDGCSYQSPFFETLRLREWPRICQSIFRSRNRCATQPPCRDGWATQIICCPSDGPGIYTGCARHSPSPPFVGEGRGGGRASRGAAPPP